MSRIGVVVIGRNEGERLRRCLVSVAGRADRVVYVDSGSSDGSVEMARAMGMDVIALDMSVPFTAARARNTGFAHLMERDPGIEFVQFVDGDCEVVEGWLETAARTLAEQPEVAMACGRNRERYPEHSIYNRLCDLEWETPVGETRACGGIAMARATAFQEVNGYNGSIIAGEEPEMCFRLRQRGWKILRIEAEMTLHDAAMERFGQWWKRAVRGGHAFAEAAAMHGRTPDRFRVREARSNWFWGLVLPAGAAALAWPTKGLSLLLLGAFPLLGLRIYRNSRRRGLSAADARAYGFFCTIGKFPQAIGQAKYWWGRWRRKPSGLIEYK